MPAISNMALDNVQQGRLNVGSMDGILGQIRNMADLEVCPWPRNDLKDRYGHRIALFGNIDLGLTPVLGSPSEVQSEVRQLIKDWAPGWWYGVSSGNSIPR